MSEPEISEGPFRRGLRTGDVSLARVGSVKAGPDSVEPYLLLDGHGRLVEPVSAWVRYMVVGDLSPRTIRSYCYAALT